MVRLLLYRRWNTIRQEQEGGVLVEFAVLMPVFLLIMLGILEIGLLMLAQVLLDGAVIAASRGGMTGFQATGQTREQTIAAIVEHHAGFLLDTGQLQLTSTNYSNFASVGQPEPFTDDNNNGLYDMGEPYTDVNGNGQWDDDMGAAGLGGPGDIVVYEIAYPWSLKTPIVGPLLSAGGIMDLKSSLLVRNQAYLTN